ncbi:MAG: TVP38/TMEM64 family protein [Eubacteriales bacterium]
MELTVEKKLAIVQKIIFVAFWLVFVVLCFVYRDEITVERITSFTPDEPLLAALVMIVLFALKSVSLFVYGGILYAACGIIFPLPQAIIINTVGTFVMTIIPYLIGRKSGSKAIAKLTEKSRKLELLHDASNRNGFFVSFFVRIVGLLPSDLVGIYLGASGISFGKYVSGTMLGLFSAVVAFSVMGMSADDPTSPAFIISAAAEIGLCILSLVLYFVLARRKKKKDCADISQTEESN